MAFTRSGVRSPSPPLAEGCAVWQGPVGLPLGSCGNSSVGRARPCQGRGRGFESRFPLWSGSFGPNEIVAGWSSLVARRAHNPEVVGSNPTPATWKDGEGGEDGEDGEGLATGVLPGA